MLLTQAAAKGHSCATLPSLLANLLSVQAHGPCIVYSS